MPFAIQTDTKKPLLLAYEEVNSDISDPQPTISAQLIAGWICPSCNVVLRAIAGPWNTNKHHWYSYDHRPVASAHQSPRPLDTKTMPRYRGEFRSDGGYLRCYSHDQPLHIGYAYNHTSKCQLGVSHKVGIEPGLRGLPGVGEEIVQGLAELLRISGRTKHMQLIPDVLGQREPILAISDSAAQAWKSETRYFYDPERKHAAWEKFILTLLEPHEVSL